MLRLISIDKVGGSKTKDINLGTVGLGVKYRFLDEDQYYVSAATFPQYFFNGEEGFLLPVFFEKTFNQWLTGIGLGYFLGVGRADFFQFGSLLGYKPTETLDLMFEHFIHQHVQVNPGFNSYLNVGFRWYLNEHFVIMGSMGTQVVTQAGQEKERFISWLGLRSLF